MSTTEESRRVVTALYTTALAGDPGFMKMLDENVVVHEPSFLAYGGVWRGRDAFAKLFATIGGYLDIPSLKLESLVADGDVVVAFLKARTVKGNEEIDLSERSIVKNGLVTEMRIYYHEGGTLFPRAPR